MGPAVGLFQRLLHPAKSCRLAAGLDPRVSQPLERLGAPTSSFRGYQRERFRGRRLAWILLDVARNRGSEIKLPVEPSNLRNDSYVRNFRISRSCTRTTYDKTLYCFFARPFE